MALASRAIRLLMSLGALAAVVSGPARSTPSATSPMAIASHRAFYEMSLGARQPGADILEIEGGLAFEWSDVCEGWTILQKAAMTFDYENGVSVRIGWVFSTWEAKDGKSYEFAIRRTRNGQVTEEVRGRATLGESGEGGIARFSMPEEGAIALPRGTVFPSQHTVELIDAAKRGDITYLRDVFDGSAMETAMAINAVISRVREFEAGELDNPLALGQVWPMNLAFFPADSDEAEPEHQQRLMIQENGVVRSLRLDYGEFTVEAELTRLEPIPADC